jgi:hypothetical protein
MVSQRRVRRFCPCPECLTAISWGRSAAAASRVEAADGRAYIATVTDEILAWLDTLPLSERLVTLHAMMFAIPALQRNHSWKSRIAVAHAAIDPTAAQLADILTAARSRVLIPEEAAPLFRNDGAPLLNEPAGAGGARASLA